uniref:Uncharacterized protein n=1 Tax=Lutzomyia longipalpis TaxID=7200 RepID=A0A1B0CTS4_LUTLO
MSSSSQMLLEFLSDELASMGESCGGGFLAHVQQICHQNASFPVTSRAIIPISAIESIAMKLTIAHVAAIAFVSMIIVMSLMLGTQYVFRYRKYQLAESKGEPDSPAHTPRTSLGSLAGNGPPSRAISTTTLLSDVISLVKFRPGGRRVKHSRLQENTDTDTLTKNCQRDEHSAEVDDGDADKSHSDDDASVMSSLTITNEKANGDGMKVPGESNSSTAVSPTSLVNSNTPPSDGSISSLPPTPLDTPMPGRRTNFEALETKSVNGSKSTRVRREIRGGSNAPDTDTESIKRMMIGAQMARNKKLSVSNVTLTNGSYSPALSMTSTATIRTTSQKESKDKRNREKLLAGPGSEFSLANPEDLELDYYDYNVINAGAAPGSYLGMDPAYLVWIPPLDQGNIIHELGEKEDSPERETPDYEEILPRHENIDPGSNTETPDEETPALMSLKNSLARGTATPVLVRKITNDSPGIQLQDFSKMRAVKLPMAARLLQRENKEEEEKETSVVKSHSDYFEMEDIKFADEDHDHDDDDCNKRIQYRSDTKQHSVKT